MATKTTQDRVVQQKLTQVKAGIDAARKAFWNLPDRELYASKYAGFERDLNEMGDNISAAQSIIDKVLRG